MQEAADRLGLKEAVKEGIFLGGKTPIKKVRCFANDVKTPIDIRMQRDKGPKDYKHSYHVKNDGNYCIGIYEGTVNGKVKRDFEVVNVLDAAKRAKKHEDILPAEKNGLPLVYNLKIGQHVLLLDKEESRMLPVSEPYKRLYTVVGISTLRIKQYSYGTLQLKHASEARRSSDLKAESGAFEKGEEKRAVISMLHSQLNAIVEDEDFVISHLGDITYLNHNA